MPLLPHSYRLRPDRPFLGWWALALVILWLSPVQASQPKHTTKLLAQAHQALIDGRAARAEQIYLRLLEKHPKGPVGSLVREQLAKFYLQTDRPAESAVHYARLLKQFPRHSNRLEFLSGLAEAQSEAGKPAFAYEAFLEVAQGQATRGRISEAYETLGRVDFGALAFVPTSLAFRLCAMASYLAERQGRLSAAVVALSAQAQWVEQGGYRWMLLQDVRRLLAKMGSTEELNWVQAAHLRSQAESEQGPELTLPNITDSEILATIESRRHEITSGVRPVNQKPTFAALRAAMSEPTVSLPTKRTGKCLLSGVGVSNCTTDN